MPTIHVAVEDLNPWHLARFLDPTKWCYLSRSDVLTRGQVDVLVLDGRYNWDRELGEVKTSLKSRINCKCLTNKVLLHEMLRNTGTTPESWTITRWSDEGVYVDPAKKYMWRPQGGWKGQGIGVVTSKQDLDERRCDLDDAQDDANGRAVLSEYIEHPLLLEGRKMSVRLYCIVATHRRGAALLKRGLLGVAREPYVQGKWDRMEVHDARTLIHRDYRFPEDFPGGEKAAQLFWCKAKCVFDEVMRLGRHQARTYRESKQGFEVLGCDLMVDARTNDVYLIEMNHKPGHKQLDPAMQDRLSSVVMAGVAQFVLDVATPGVDPVYERVGVAQHEFANASTT